MADVNDDNQNAAARGRTPPYVAFKTFLTLLGELKTNGVPPQIDRSVLSRFAGGVQSQLMLAMKALALMNDDNKPLPRLGEVVHAFGGERFREELAKLLRDAYPYVFSLDPMNATPAMFAASFSEDTDAKEDVLRKCRTFFLHAAKEAGIPLGPRIENAKFPRSRSSTPRKPKVKKQEAPGGGAPPPPPPSANKPENISNAALEYKLVDLMKEPDVGDEERNAIWVLIQYLTRKKQKKAADE